MEGLDQVIAVAGHAGLDALGKVGVDELTRVLLGGVGCGLAPADAARLDQVRMCRLVSSRALRIVGPGPTLAPVKKVAEQVEMFMPARRAGIEGLASAQLHAWDNEVQLVMPGVGVSDPEDVVLLGLEPGKGQ